MRKCVNNLYVVNKNFTRKHSNKMLTIGALLMAIGLAPELSRLLERQKIDQRLNSNYPVETVQLTPIDRDELSDLVINGRLLLADKTDDGIIYRTLRNSDIYRVR